MNQPLKIARSHLINTIEHSLSLAGSVSDIYPHYVIEATPYRISGEKGNSGVRVTWRGLRQSERDKQDRQKSKKKAGKK